MFFGTFTPKLDDKGRLTLPAKFREELGDGLMVVKGQDRSLAVYPKAEFLVRAKKAAEASRTNPKARAFVRNLAASADEQTLDSQGRISVSAMHRSYAGLTKECVVIGNVDFIEIWDAESWAEYSAEHEEDFSDGDDEVLARVNKGETYSSTLDALEKLGEAGISRSVMILNGLGGMTLSAQHADNSARLMNAAQPEYLSTLVVSFPTGEQRFRAGFADFEALDRRALFVEVERLLQGLELEDTVFRSDHASNYLVLKGELGADKARLLAEVRQAIEQPQHAALRQEWQRGL